jgi:hypothetical protein
MAVSPAAQAPEQNAAGIANMPPIIPRIIGAFVIGCWFSIVFLVWFNLS